MLNRSLIRAVAWRRAARLRDRLPGGGRDGSGDPAATAVPGGLDLEGQLGPAGAAGPESEAAAPSPTPVLVDYFGRDGSTAVMRLLASSHECTVAGGYPYESQLLVHLWRWSLLLGRAAWPSHGWERDEAGAAASTAPLAAGRLSDWPFPQPSGCEAGPGSEAFDLLWPRLAAAVAGAAGERPGEARFYAEKRVDTWRWPPEELPPGRRLVLLRDPRDTWLSIEAFSRAVGRDALGGGGSDADRLDRFVERQRERLRWVAGLGEDEATIVIRYERLVEDLPGTASRIGGWLGIELDPDRVSGDRRLRWVHATSPSISRSVGRWRREMDPERAAAFTAALEGELAAVGY